MQEKVKNFFQKKRTFLQAIVFYFLSLVLGIVILIPIVGLAITIFSYFPSYPKVNVPAIFSSFYSLVICLLVLKTKNQKKILTIFIAGLIFIMSTYIGVVFTLLFPAIFTMLPIKQGKSDHV